MKEPVYAHARSDARLLDALSYDVKLLWSPANNWTSNVLQGCAILASISEPEAETALRRMKGPLIAAMICHAPRSEPSRLANPTATKAKGNRVSNRPPTAPQAAIRGSDNSSNLRRRPAIPSTVEKSAPPKKPGIASAGNGAYWSPLSAHRRAPIRPPRSGSFRPHRGCVSATSSLLPPRALGPSSTDAARSGPTMPRGPAESAPLPSRGPCLRCPAKGCLWKRAKSSPEREHCLRFR